LPVGVEKTRKIRQDSRCPGRDIYEEICLEGLKKPGKSVRIVGVPAEIFTKKFACRG
jgi:hypothetical protein